ncbi:hypothetical protein [Alicyclobacillus fastidiosus]|uniref:Copper amine oxidase-like N-terminal domain-containing protein n=1 Tax=Alicyclobacillus fastidiosus TaxID=392011 RepID=A0ABV5AHF8_9BACL|nr:hypothetical protein [Alicyclobacillus fastidiosus]WEH09196.1 hypothetical protein PYS47_21395 [Alicyclobacillus fastidiosus]
MKRNRVLAALSGILAVGAVLASLPSTADAATKYYLTKIEINGSDIANPGHLVAVDPFGGGKTETSYLPIWYVDEALQKLGITPSWDGAEGVLSLSVPSTMQVTYPTPPTPMAIDSQIMKIEVNGQVMTYAPRQTAVDQGSNGVVTTYVPIYYLEKTLIAIGITVGWDGTSWTMTYTATAPSTPSTPSGDTKLAAALAFAQAAGIRPNPDAGANPYSDVPESVWPTVSSLVSSYTWVNPVGSSDSMPVGSPLFTPDSAATFGSNDPTTLTDLATAFEVYSGLQAGHNAFLPGGSLQSFAQITGLTKNVSDTGNLTQNDISTIMTNFQNVEKGYISLGGNKYQLVYRPAARANFWDTSIPAQTFANDWGNSIKVLDQVTTSYAGGTFTTHIPGYSDSHTSSGNFIELAGISSPEQVSTDGGSTWKTVSGPLGYDSLNSDEGGVSTAPIAGVLIKDSNGGGVTVGYNYNGQTHGFAVGGMVMDNGQLVASYQ